MKRSLYFKKSAVLFLCLAVAFLCGCRSTPLPALSCAGKSGDVQFSEYEDLAVFTEALLLVNRYYAEKSDFTELVYSAIDGMVGDLDPHSSFLAPESLKSLNESTEGSFVGIGINVEPGEQGVKVVAPLEGSPALKAGIKAGDTITAVDGQSLKGASLDKAVGQMRGEEGSTVEVTVKRSDGASEKVALIRDSIKLSCVESCRKLDDQTGFLRIRQFTSSTGDDVEKALRSLEKQGVQKMILDLRDNPGGVLSSAVDLSAFFLKKGELIVSLKNRAGGKKERDFKSGGGYKFPDVPMAVLVNHGSASASEVVTGALRDNQRAVIVGTRTYGKASVQSVIKMSLRPECAVRLTTGYYYTPGKELIHGRGIPPDEEVSLSYAQHSVVKKFFMHEAYRKSDQDIPAEDLQLAKARELLNSDKSGERKL